MSNNVVVANEILITVPKKTLQKQIKRLEDYIRTANSVSGRSTFTEINLAEIKLHRARELFTVLWEEKVLPNWQEVEEVLNRIDAKMINIRSEKNKCYRPEVRRS